MALPKLPKNFNQTKHLIKVIQRIHNRNISKSFEDVVKNPQTATKGRIAVYRSILVKKDDSWLEVIVKLLLFYIVLGNHRGGDAIATMPEFWAFKNPRNRAQLCIIYKIKNPKPTQTYTSYQITIPNFNSRSNPSDIPAYKKGNYLGTLHLQDGSKLRINGRDESETKRVRDIMVKHIRKPALTNAVWREGHRKDELNDVEVYPFRADFYPRGKKKGVEPKWSYDFIYKKKYNRLQSPTAK